MATKVILFAALAAILASVSAQGLSRVSGTYNGKYYDYSRYPSTGRPDRYYDDDMDALKLKKLGKKIGGIAKKGLKAYQTYQQYKGMLPIDDDMVGLSRVSGYYNGKYYDYSKYPTTGRSDRYYDDDERFGGIGGFPSCYCVRAPCPCDDDMDALKLKKLGKKIGGIAKKGLKAYQTYQQYKGMLPIDDDVYDEFDPELSVTASYNNGPWSVSGTHDFQTRNGNIQGSYVQGPWDINMQHNWDDDMDALSFKKLGKKVGGIAKKGLKAYQTYQQYKGMLPIDDDVYDEFDPELSVTASYNNGPWSVSGTHDFQTRNGNIQGSYVQGPWDINMQHNWDDDMDALKLKKLGKKIGGIAKKGLKAYQTYQKYRGMLPIDDDESNFGGRHGGFY